MDPKLKLTKINGRLLAADYGGGLTSTAKIQLVTDPYGQPKRAVWAKYGVGVHAWIPVEEGDYILWYELWSTQKEERLEIYKVVNNDDIERVLLTVQRWERHDWTTPIPDIFNDAMNVINKAAYEYHNREPLYCLPPFFNDPLDPKWYGNTEITPGGTVYFEMEQTRKGYWAMWEGYNGCATVIAGPRGERKRPLVLRRSEKSALFIMNPGDIVIQTNVDTSFCKLYFQEFHRNKYMGHWSIGVWMYVEPPAFRNKGRFASLLDFDIMGWNKTVPEWLKPAIEAAIQKRWCAKRTPVYYQK